MCYSAQSSITTFAFVFGVCVYLWHKGNPIRKTLAIILFFIGLMQIVEFFIWLNVECSQTNKLISLAIPVLLFLQPVVVLGAIIYFNSGRFSDTVYKSLLLIWFLCAPLFVDLMKTGFNKCTTIGNKGHLVWPYVKSFHNGLSQDLYNFMLMIGIGSLNTQYYGIFYVISSTLSLKYIQEIYGHSWGSVWCNFVNFLAIGALFV
jgi:hypothetical protein